jgi:polyhydroxyalkanoate depolymerase
VLALSGLTHTRPSFRLGPVETPAGPVPVQETVVARTEFCSLLHFRKPPGLEPGPRVLLVAPVSGHFATLLRGTLQTLLRDHDVYVTDWHNVRDIPLAAGTFDLDAFIRHVIHFFDVLGPRTHGMAVCQPTVPVLAAAALMAEDEHPARPASLTLLAGPIDCRINPTEVNRLATSRPLEWFEQNLISVVPLRCRGAMRRVYPGYLQISAFMSMGLDRHRDSFRAMYGHFLEGETVKARRIRDFYDEYLAAMDLPAEFYLQTVKNVFQDYQLPRGVLHLGSRRVRPECIRDGGLFTVEGEKDDICGLGQTHAAHALCSQLPAPLHQHHVQEGAGHYGVFNGRRWEEQIYPRLRDFIHARDAAGGRAAV